jgi:type III pantothenate kinase
MKRATNASLWAIDVGTSRTAAALFLGRRRPAVVRISSKRPSGLLDWVRDLLRRRRADGLPAVVASVNPRQGKRIVASLAGVLGAAPLQVPHDVLVPIEVDVENPEAVGADRLCDAYAALQLAGAPVIVADLGSAVTIDVVDERGRFLGGGILPGPATQAKALRRMAKHLPKVDVREAAPLPGRNTEQAMVAGIRRGLAGAVAEIVAALRGRVRGRAPLVVTGGAAECLLRHAPGLADLHVENLCLQGIRAAYGAWKRRRGRQE